LAYVYLHIFSGLFIISILLPALFICIIFYTILLFDILSVLLYYHYLHSFVCARFKV